MKKIFKENFKFIIILILVLLIFNIEFPYYIDAPGGISNIEEKIEIEGYKSEGSFNLAYVKEYKATIHTLLISLFNKDYNIYKKEEVLLETENDDTYFLRDRILMEESISNAIGVAYKNANKKIKIISNKLLITYITPLAKTDLEIGDEIIEINNKKVYTKDEITTIVNNLNYEDKLKIKIKNNNEIYERYAYIINDNDSKKIGTLISYIKEYKTDPSVSVKIDKNESGSSGGLITALYIYDSLIKEDITNGLKIVGTGTIDEKGNIGSIGGVKYKLKSAVKEKADLFIVPYDENYDEAIKLKKDNNYNIKIIGVSTFEDVLNYLKNTIKK